MSARHLAALRLAVRAILDNAHSFEWSVQGFGVLRLYVANVGRIHVWHRALRYPDVSTIHDHSWDLESVIVSGCLGNTRFIENPDGRDFWKRKLVTGYNTKFVEEPRLVGLVASPTETYRPGDTYSQRAAEIHESVVADGTVTIMSRKEDVEGQATVYWPANAQWGTAKPRPAAYGEVALARRAALEFLRGTDAP